jgi:hypothetical protein
VIGWLAAALAPVLAAPLPVAEAPPLLYLDEPTVRQELHGHLPALAPCFGDLGVADADYTLAMAIGRDGVGREPQLTPADSERQACLATILADLRFSPHHEDPVLVRTILVWRQGRLVPHPQVALSQRPESLLFVYVVDPDAARALEAALRAPRAAD